jgi:hypothetical protein
MSVSFPFQQQFTWRKLGFLYFTNSLSYREVLEENPQWKVTELPPVGAQIRLSNVSPQSTPGGITQGSFILGAASESSTESFFPFSSEEEYYTSLNRYTLQGVIDRVTLNGVTLDSTQAITGQQTG